MKQDPFGNLTDWGTVLDLFEELGDNGTLSECQPGLVRILRYKGNWRLREEALKRIGEIQNPSDELISQVMTILADDNIYYDVRILAGEALTRILRNIDNDYSDKISMDVRKITEKLRSTPQPPLFENALRHLYSEATHPEVM
ncbi:MULTISPECIES: HEAT repeat domain-containing protein [Desulfococcus]|jgi:hypothetical protein|uniref:PBS lyase HEAT domain protein repeat-containing protein n=1 Tax=Desulfococcus multivorans DSM 2059 TaxID=1121405 RepID=S7UZP3_DESML|nr:HEAT repeat domain-containing protein [Desulfococcus multivorans]AOY60616.1 uncharacterized protein Dmul_38480 [Desulfococcus multivorans]AQV02707.1 hypothetical protein B2D07_19285 [Desulfococcus multivorans]EPR39674.1 hypothetical protein dsmv_2522 [Desulfococcus multivorans DSM 2059]MDX9819294.1 HEAT repeat domain-containing protein [Desulfococcus multivorans]SKA03823.1 hypothetical protein SAMN02745446_02506 [Desulfococcus multivorans DSM 2059]